MKTGFHTSCCLAGLLALCTGTVSAQTTFFPDDVIIEGNLRVQVPAAGPGNPSLGSIYVEDDSVIDGSLCLGNTCTQTTSFANDETLRMQFNELSIVFVDTSTTGFPDRDWTLRINDLNTYADGGIDRFSIEDDAANTTPFTIAGGAPENAFWLASSGQIGLGTSLPSSDIHIVQSNLAQVKLEVTAGSTGNRDWSLATSGQVMAITYDDLTRIPLAIYDGAPTNSLVIDASGQIGMGTVQPEEKLHIRTNTPDTDSFALFDAGGAGSDSAFRLRQNGLTPSTWEFRNQQDSGRLNVGLAGGNTPFKIDNAANNNLLRLGRNGLPGEVNITGTLVVNNTALNVPDYVFADDYALRPLAEVQAFIDANSHLPDVPSEAEIKANGVDMTAMQMALLKKVEELTLYTLEQEARLAEVDALRAELAEVKALLAAPRP